MLNDDQKTTNDGDLEEAGLRSGGALGREEEEHRRQAPHRIRIERSRIRRRSLWAGL